MTTGQQAAPGSAAAPGAAPGAAPAGNPGAAAPAAAAPAAGVPTWATGLQDAGNRDFVTTKGWATPDDPIKGYRELETRLGSAIVPPAADAPPEVVNAFYDKLGRPKTAAEYKFQRPAGVPADFPYVEGEVAALNEIAHKAGLTQAQAAAIHDGIVTRAASQLAAEQTAEIATIEAADAELVKMWGDKDGEAFKRNVELSNRAIRNLGGEPLLAELKKLGAIGRDGEVKSPILANLLAQAGKGMFGEDTLFAGPNVQNNPWTKDNENVTEQGKIFKANPDRARQMIKAAGRDQEPAFRNIMAGRR